MVKKPKCKLIGQDGNVFNLAGIASIALKKAKMEKESREMVAKICRAKSYEEAFTIISEYVEVR